MGNVRLVVERVRCVDKWVGPVDLDAHMANAVPGGTSDAYGVEHRSSVSD